jgi:hypothetical protein
MEASATGIMIGGMRGDVMPAKDEEARSLARMHYQVEPGLTHVYRVTGTSEAEDMRGEPIKLLEVNRNTVPSGILPIQFGPSPAAGLNFSSIIVEVTPEEFQKIQDREWILPNGWKVAELIPRSDDRAAG